MSEYQTNTALVQAARRALEAFPTLTEFFNRYVESIGGPYFSELDRIALLAVRELPRIEGALREALEAVPQPAAVEQEPVAWMFQHEEAGLIMCVDVQQVESGFEKNNPRWQKVCPLYKAPQPARQPLTDEQIASACLSYRHDFGLLSKKERESLIFQAREWERALEKERGIGGEA